MGLREVGVESPALIPAGLAGCDEVVAVERLRLENGITQSLLTLMGGSVSIESEYGVGSTFTITLPQGVDSTEPVGNIQARFEEHMQLARTYRETFHAPDARILIVDDTPISITVVVGLLKSTEMLIDTAASGEDALEMTKANAYGLILLDQRMPGMDGTKTLRRRFLLVLVPAALYLRVEIVCVHRACPRLSSGQTLFVHWPKK